MSKHVYHSYGKKTYTLSNKYSNKENTYTHSWKHAAIAAIKNNPTNDATDWNGSSRRQIGRLGRQKPFRHVGDTLFVCVTNY